MLQLQFSAHPAPWEQLRKHLVCACLKPCLLLRIEQGSRTQWDHGDSWCPSTQTTHTCTQTHMYRHTSSPTQTHAKMYNFTLTQIHTYVQTHKITHTYTHIHEHTSSISHRHIHSHSGFRVATFSSTCNSHHFCILDS